LGIPQKIERSVSPAVISILWRGLKRKQLLSNAHGLCENNENRRCHFNWFVYAQRL